MILHTCRPEMIIWPSYNKSETGSEISEKLEFGSFFTQLKKESVLFEQHSSLGIFTPTGSQIVHTASNFECFSKKSKKVSVRKVKVQQQHHHLQIVLHQFLPPSFTFMPFNVCTFVNCHLGNCSQLQLAWNVTLSLSSPEFLFLHTLAVHYVFNWALKRWGAKYWSNFQWNLYLIRKLLFIRHMVEAIGA